MGSGETADLNLSQRERIKGPNEFLERLLAGLATIPAGVDLERKREELLMKAAFSIFDDECQPRVGTNWTLKDTRETILAAKNARRFIKWENSNSQHEHSQGTMAGHEFEETSQCNMPNSDSGYVESLQSAHMWKTNIQPGASVKEDVVLDIPEDKQLSPVGTLPPGFCQSHMQKDNINSAYPLMLNPDGRAGNTMIVSHNISVNTDRPGTLKETEPGHNTSSDCSTLPPDSSQSPASLLVAQNGLLELTRPDTSNENEVESRMHDTNDCTLPLPGNQDALSSKSMIVALNVPLDLNEPNPSHLMETESQVHDNDDPALLLPVNRGSSATHRYFGTEVNVMLAGINGAAIVGLSSFAPKDSSLKHVFAGAVGIGFFGSLFAILCRRKLKQATILSKIGIIGTSSAILVALGTEFGVNFVVIVLVCLIFALVMMVSD